MHCQEQAPDCRYPGKCVGFGTGIPCRCVAKEVGHTDPHRCTHHEWEVEKMCCDAELGTKENPYQGQLFPEIYAWYCREGRCGQRNILFNKSVEGRIVACLNCGTWHRMVL